MRTWEHVRSRESRRICLRIFNNPEGKLSQPQREGVWSFATAFWLGWLYQLMLPLCLRKQGWVLQSFATKMTQVNFYKIFYFFLFVSLMWHLSWKLCSRGHRSLKRIIKIHFGEWFMLVELFFPQLCRNQGSFSTNTPICGDLLYLWNILEYTLIEKTNVIQANFSLIESRSPFPEQSYKLRQFSVN